MQHHTHATVAQCRCPCSDFSHACIRDEVSSHAAYVWPAVAGREQDGKLLSISDEVDGNDNAIFGTIGCRHALLREATVTNS